VLLFSGQILAATMGCAKESPEEIHTLQGRVEKVRRSSDASGEISVRFYSEKNEREIVGTATVTPQTRIERAGQAASLADVQEGVQVKGQVRSIKKDGQRTYEALLIEIESPPAGGQ
jgi:hypothetical protein